MSFNAAGLTFQRHWRCRASMDATATDYQSLGSICSILSPTLSERLANKGRDQNAA